MGTRHLIAAIVNGEPRLAQYGKWDGYLSGQGQKVVDFVSTHDMEHFKAKLLACYPVKTADEANKIAGLPNASGIIPAVFSWDTGADILPMIWGTAEPLNLHCWSWDFGNDSLFCEWAYVIDLDAMKLEVYRGFQKEPPTAGRWVGGPKDGDYYPIQLVATFDLDNIPSDWRSQCGVKYDDE